MIISESKFTTIYNSFWRNWRKQDKLGVMGASHYQFIPSQELTVYHYRNANNNATIRVEVCTSKKFRGGEYQSINFQTYIDGYENIGLMPKQKTYYTRIGENE